jgi:hypothetical protein
VPTAAVIPAPTADFEVAHPEPSARVTKSSITARLEPSVKKTDPTARPLEPRVEKTDPEATKKEKPSEHCQHLGAARILSQATELASPHPEPPARATKSTTTAPRIHPNYPRLEPSVKKTDPKARPLEPRVEKTGLSASRRSADTLAGDGTGIAAPWATREGDKVLNKMSLYPPEAPALTSSPPPSKLRGDSRDPSSFLTLASSALMDSSSTSPGLYPS